MLFRFMLHVAIYNLTEYNYGLQADLFLAPQLDAAIKRFNVDMVLFYPCFSVYHFGAE